MYFLCSKEEIPEWSAMYFRREQVYSLLALFKSFPQKIETEQFKFYIAAQNYFWETIDTEFEKIKAFNHFMMAKISYELSFLRSLLPQVYRISNEDHSVKAYNKIRKALLSIYHEARLSILFTNTNKRRLQFVLKSYKEYAPKIFLQNNSTRMFLSEKSANAISDSNFKEAKVLAEEEYLDLPYGENKKDEFLIVRQEYICPSSPLLLKYSFHIVMWVLLMIIFLSFFSFYSEIVNASPIDNSLLEVFPIYRGLFLFNIYFWVLISNVFTWSVYDVNYSLIFGFRSITELSQLLISASVFTLISASSFIGYTIHNFLSSSLNDDVIVMKNIYAALPWSILFVYLFFPSKKYFNWEGRKYFFKLWASIALVVMKSPTLKVLWFSDQLISLVKPIQDIEYSLCYYFTLPQGNQGDCIHSERITNTILITSFLLLIRMSQEAKLTFDSRNIKSPSTVNFFKYSLALLTVFVSYFSETSDALFYLWIVLALFSTVYSVLWDLYCDFGIKSIYDPVGNKTFSKNFYSASLAFKIIFSFTWILSLSEKSIKRLKFFQVFSLVIAILEILRRGVWNLLKIDYDHRKNVEVFQITKSIREDRKYYHIPNSHNLKPNSLPDNNLTEMQLMDEEKNNNGHNSNSVYSSKKEFPSTKFDLDILDPEKASDVSTEKLAKGLVMRDEALKKAQAKRIKSEQNFIRGDIFTR